MSAGDRDTLTATLAAIIAHHTMDEGFTGVDSAFYRNYMCTCGWWSTSDQEPDFRAHVADVLLGSDWLAAYVRAACAKAWQNGVDTAGQYAEQPWIVDEECTPLNPYLDAGDEFQNPED